MARNVKKGMSFRSRLLIGAAASAAALSSGGVFAQQGVEEIVVTGTRIARQDYISASPLTTVGAETLQRTGTLTVESILNDLPQVVPDLTATSNNPSANGGPGQANINLRGLGSVRNLVLVNGRRMIGGDENLAVDVNTIPTALIERVEVISGGASAVYGADAVAGVVNFILKQDFEGIQADGQFGISGKGDAKEESGALTMGGNFANGKGNAVVNFSYANRHFLGKGEREYTKQAVNVTSFLPQGSFVPEGTNLPTQAAVDQVWARYGLPAGSAVRTDRFSFNRDGSLFSTSTPATAPNVSHLTDPIDDTIATAFFPGRYSYNFEPENALVIPLQRKSAAAMAKYEVTEWAEAYFQFLFTNYSSSQQLAPSPAPTGSQGAFFVPVTNPYIPNDLRTILASRPNPTANMQFLKRFNDVGPRRATNSSNVFHVTGGLRGALPNDWRWDIYASHGRLDATEIQKGNVSYNAIQRLLTAADGGASLCAGGFNIFGRGGISAACADYIEVTAKNQRSLTQDVIEASITGDIFEVPAGDVGFALGAQYWANGFTFEPDQVLASGDVSGFNAQQPLQGDVNNKDFFFELAVPVVRDIDFVKSFDITGGFRFSDHSAANTFNSYKIEGDWQVVDALRFRGSYQKAVRAPNIGELYAPQNEDNPEVVDPCNSDSPQRRGPNAAQVRALCIAQGVNPAVIDFFQQPNAQLDALDGGNPNLREETANSFTVGAVVSAPFEGLERLSLSVDYYNIKIKGVIDSINADISVGRCFNAGGANPSYSNSNIFCQMFGRRTVDSAIEDVLQVQQNLSKWKIDGIDTQIDYGFDIGDDMGSLDLNLLVSYMHSFKKQVLPGDPYLQYAGTVAGVSDIGETFPKWKSTFTATWSMDPFMISGRARFIDKMKNSLLVADPTAVATGVKSTWYFDLTGQVALFDHVTMRAGVLNVANQKPRLYTPSVQDGTDPSVYDVIGRRFFVSASVKF